MYFRPNKRSVAADVIPYFENGKYYLFYLRDDRDIEKVGEGCEWHLLITEDLVHFEDKGVVIHQGNKDEQDLYVYTGCVIKKEDTYYIFYTGHNPHFERDGRGAQKVLMAKSKDLIHWEKEKDFILAPNDPNLEQNDFRDPFVFYENGEYVMVLTGRMKNAPLLQCKGVLLSLRSKDLINWKMDEKPFYNPQAYYAHECPDIFKIGEWWYLIFSEFSDRYVTTYRMSKSLDGEWITPKHNTFDGHAFYAAKTASDGKRRLLFGWNPTKEGDDDNRYWQWGGNIVPHELVQNDDGTLSVKCPIEVRKEFNKELPIKEEIIIGEKQDDVLLGNKQRTILSLGKLEEHAIVEFDVAPLKDQGDFGLILNEKENYEFYYQVRFDATLETLCFDKWPRFDRTKHHYVDVERPWGIKVNQKNHVIAIVQGSVLEVYVNDQIAMSARMYEKGDNFAIYAVNTDVRFENISYRKVKDE